MGAACWDPTLGYTKGPARPNSTAWKVFSCKYFSSPHWERYSVMSTAGRHGPAWTGAGAGWVARKWELGAGARIGGTRIELRARKAM